MNLQDMDRDSLERRVQNQYDRLLNLQAAFDANHIEAIERDDRIAALQSEIASLEAVYGKRDKAHQATIAFLRDLAEDGCLCAYHPGDCPSCRTKAFLKEFS